jgi:aspartyl-tRNA(Asn)/glutamyl-tRNA(Gln) amidotransferase subunit B
MPSEYEPVIGLEVHAQLLTETKLFCACSTRFGASPNENVCPVCLGLPGALPVLNEKAVEMAVRAALALDCTIHETSNFARKNYFYPDLPKGYQVSQYDAPFSSHGRLGIDLDGRPREIGIVRVHLEEDAGKNVHGVGGDSLVDLNRAGTPLIEIVGAPELRSSAEAQAYLRALRDILVFLEVNDGNLEEGSFRCDANVSIRPVGSCELGTRTEIKNVNSFRFVGRAIEVEIARQIALLRAGGAVEQETRGYDSENQRTFTLRSKEDAHDYRYFPEPDLPPLRIDAELVAVANDSIGELPAELRRRYADELGLSREAVTTLTQHPGVVRFFERARQAFPDPVKVANWTLTEVLRGAKLHGLEASFPVQPEQLAELLGLVEDGTISGKQAKEVYAAISDSDRSPRQVVEERGLRVISDDSTLLPICERLVAAHPAQAAEVRAGKKGVLGFFVGQVMKETGGSADPRRVSALLERLIAGAHGVS